MATQSPSQTVAGPGAAASGGPSNFDPIRIPIPGLGREGAALAAGGAGFPSAPQSGTQATNQPSQQAAAPAAVTSAPAESGEMKLVPSAGVRLQELAALAGEDEGLRLSGPMERLPVELRVAVPVRSFRVRNLLAMAAGELIETEWGSGDDLPLSSGDVQVAWSEFEVVETRLAVRVTRLS